MAVLIFRLRGVPEDEQRDVESLLNDNHIAWYATDAGNWGIAMPAIWLENDDDRELAAQLIGDYQATRSQQARAAHEQLRQSGHHTTLMQQLMRHPLQVMAIVLFCLFIVYVMIRPFIDLATAPAG